MVVPPGDGVLFTPSEIFSFKERSLVTSASKVASRCCSWRFVFSKFVMWFVAMSMHQLRGRKSCATITGHTSFQQ